MNSDERYMLRCIEIASNGLGNVTPNPMVGCIIVHNDKIIGEGYHRKYGGPHAEVHAIESVQNKSMLSESTLYVCLEPCSHHGKTPPCSDLIIKHHLKRVVIGCIDSHSKVAGKGVKKLKDAGIQVDVSILPDQCRNLNKRFFTFHEKNRPYVILKWAQTTNGYIDNKRTKNDTLPLSISNSRTKQLSHLWRTQESSIMIGTNTALLDNPKLNARLATGQNPIRIVLDRNLQLPANLSVFDQNIHTIVFNQKQQKIDGEIEYIKCDMHIRSILAELHERDIQSIIVEGGATLHQQFIQNQLWDEGRIFIAPNLLKDGVKAADIPFGKIIKESIDNNELITVLNQ